MNQIIVDGYDLGSFGLVVESFRGRYSPPAVEWDEYDDPTTPGVIVATPRRGGRTVECVGWIHGPTPAAAQESLDRISWVLNRRNVHEITFPDRPGATLQARARVLSARPARAESVVGLYHVSIEIFAAELPFFAALSQTVVSGIGGSPVELPAGTADIIDVVIAIAGAATDPEITIRDYLGSVVASLAFTLEVGGGDFLVLDLRRKTAYENDTGQPNEGDPRIGVAYWPGGPGNEWFVLDAGWWDPISEIYATAECSSGTAEFRYRITSET